MELGAPLVPDELFVRSARLVVKNLEVDGEAFSFEARHDGVVGG